ncbi:transporter substrate-binding domain-containing protein [Pseudomonadota bacterium]|nr:transporter substrate-binding domain-containing protein [Pseudomonadota bacterium]
MHKLILTMEIIALLFLVPITNASESVRVVTEVYPPYQTIKDDGTYSGIAVEVVRAILDKADVKAKVEILPWARAYKTAQKDPNIIIFSMVKSPERLDKFNWIGPLYRADQKTYFVALKERKDIVVNHYDDLKKYRICLDLDGWSYELLLKMGFKYNKNLFTLRSSQPHLQQNFNSNSLDELRMEVLTSHVCDVVLHSGGILDEKYHKRLKHVLDHTEASLRLHLAISKQSSPALVAKVSNAYNALLNDGSLYKSCIASSPVNNIDKICQIFQP